MVRAHPAPAAESFGLLEGAEKAKIRECDVVIDIIDTVIHTDSDLHDSRRPYTNGECDIPPGPQSLNVEVPQSLSFASSASVYSRMSSPDPSILPLTPDPSSPTDTAHIVDPSDRAEGTTSDGHLVDNIDAVVQNLGQRRGFKGSPLITRPITKKPSFLGPLSPLTPTGSRVFSSMSNLIRPSSPKDSALQRQIPPSIQSDYTHADPFSTNALSYSAPDSMVTTIKATNLYNFSNYEDCISCSKNRLHKVPSSKLHAGYKRISSVFAKKTLKPKTHVYDMAIYGYDDGVGNIKSKLKLSSIAMAGASPPLCLNPRVCSLRAPDIVFTPPSAPSSPKKAKPEVNELSVTTDALPLAAIHPIITVAPEVWDTIHGNIAHSDSAMTPALIGPEPSMDDLADDPQILPLRYVCRDAGPPHLSLSDLEGLRSCPPPLIDNNLSIHDPKALADVDVASQALEGIIVLLGPRLDHPEKDESNTPEVQFEVDPDEDTSCAYGGLWEGEEGNMGCAV